MSIRLYSTSRPDFQPILFTEKELTNPTLSTLQLILNSISPLGLTFGGFIVAATLWIISACEAIQITCLGYLLSALSQPVDEQPLPPKWLFPVEIFSLSSSQTAILSSAVYLGMLIGGLLSSPLEKFHGSRPALLLCCISSLLAYFGSAQAPNFLTLTICQTIGGLSFGARVAVVYSNLAQLFPNHQIGFVVTTASFVWVLGSMYASTIGYLTLGSIFGQSWRVYMLLLTIPSILALILAFFFAYETIHFGVYKQFRPSSAIDLFKIHHGKVFSHSCKRFWSSLFCCCTRHSLSLTDPNGTIDDTNMYKNDDYSNNPSNRYNNLKQQQQDNQLLVHYKQNSVDHEDANDSEVYQHPLKTEDFTVWNVDVDNSTSVEKLCDFLHEQLVSYTTTLAYNKKHNIVEEQEVVLLSTPEPNQIINNAPTGLVQTHTLSHTPSKQFNDNSSFQSDLTELSDYFEPPSSLNELVISTSKAKTMTTLSRTQQLFLLVILCAVWFIVSFQAAGFWSFLPLLWDRVFPNQSDDMKYIVSLIFSAVQLPAGLINMIIISRVFPPHLLLASSLISLFAMSVVTAVFKSQLTVATIFVFVCQFGLSTAWCAINYVALQYFPDDKKILYFAIQASVGKFGAFVAQYVFAFLLEKNSFLLMLVVTILSGISVLCCFWFNYSVRNAITTH